VELSKSFAGESHEGVVTIFFFKIDLGSSKNGGYVHTISKGSI